jgi:integrase
MSSSIIERYQKGGSRTDSKAKYILDIQSDPISTKNSKISALNMFDEFASKKYGEISSDGLVLEMLEKPDMQDGLFGVLHDFIQYLQDGKLSPSSIPVYLYFLRVYLIARGVKIDIPTMNSYFRSHGTIKKGLKERKRAVQLKELQAIINHVPEDKQQLYLVLISSGMRINEALRIKRSDIDLSEKKAIITIRAEIAKTKQERITLISDEALTACQSLFDRLHPTDLVFGSTKTSWKYDVSNHVGYFQRLRVKLGYNEKYKSGTNKITIHTFRSYFISKCGRVDNAFGHYLSGHNAANAEYERYEIEELIELYRKVEPELTILDLERYQDKIKELNNNNLKYQELNIKIELYQKLIKSLPVSAKIVEQKARELKDNF